MFFTMTCIELDNSVRALVAAMFLDWAFVPILAFPIPTSTSSGAFLLAFATLAGWPPEAGGLEAQPKKANSRHITDIIPIIFFIMVLPINTFLTA
jgi:hypothetical protein